MHWLLLHAFCAVKKIIGNTVAWTLADWLALCLQEITKNNKKTKQNRTKTENNLYIYARTRTDIILYFISYFQ